MKKEELLKLVESLKLPKGEYYILGGGSLVMFGLKETTADLDLCVSDELFARLKEEYNLKEENKKECGFYPISDIIEIIPNPKEKFNAEEIDGYLVEKPSQILEFKKKRNAPKDIPYIDKIEKFIESRIQSKKNLIIVCSKNKAKNDAVKNVLKQYFEDFEIKSLETNSGVSETPIGDEEGLTGCYNRINDAINQEENGDFYIAMEGILTETTFGTFLCGWTVIYNKAEDEYLYGCSAKIRIPNEIIEKTSKSQRLSDVVAEFVGSTGDEISKIGTNGVLTHGAYTRTDEFIDSIICAISSKYKKIENK